MAETASTTVLAEYVSNLSFDEIPAAVVTRTKQLVLDQLGCELAFGSLPWSEAALRYARTQFRTGGTCTVAGHDMRTTAEGAAFVNASFGHGFEMDDTEMVTASHPGSVVVPAAVAVAETLAASGRELIVAVVAGYEAMLRTLLACRGLVRRGFHSTAVGGPIGAAVAAARLMKLDAGKTRDAIGLAASQAGGITEYAVSGGWVKRCHAGFAARSGVAAATMASVGVTGPQAPLEGRRGLLQAVSDEVAPDELVRELGRRLRVLDTGTKPHCCCAAQHAALDATAALIAEHPVRAEDVAEVVVRMRPREAGVVGNIVEPADITSAQFSAAFGVALRIVRGANGFADYTQANVEDPQVRALARRVRVVAAQDDPELAHGDAPASVAIRRVDGSMRQTCVTYAKGTPANPMTAAEIEDKFRRMTAARVPDHQARAIEEYVDRLEELDDVRALANSLAGPADH